MPQRKSVGEMFIEYLQQELGTQVDVPVIVTDVPRATRYPGLEPRSEQDVGYGSSLSDLSLPAGGLPEPTIFRDDLEY